MTLIELLQHPATNVPITYTQQITFRKLIKSKLSHFEKLLEQLTDDTISQERLAFYKKSVQALSKGLIDTINKFYEGKPSKAYDKFESVMRSINITEYLDKGAILPEYTNLYRLRSSPGNYPLTKEELFHIPFDKRGSVRSQRFSIPGLPSLYTANSIYVAWEEMRRPNLDAIQAMRLVSTRELRLLDITTDIYSATYVPGLNGYDNLWNKIFIWPLVACCSVKVLNPESSFKPEYIIPQILLQWTNVNLDGIKYSSTHIDRNLNKHFGHFYNVVLPVKSFTFDTGYCPVLRQMFLATSPVPVQLRHHVAMYGRLNNQPTISANVNRDIEELSIIDGSPQMYSQTSFGVVEHILQGLEPTLI